MRRSGKIIMPSWNTPVGSPSASSSTWAPFNSRTPRWKPSKRTPGLFTTASCDPLRNITGTSGDARSSSARVGSRLSANRVWLEEEPATISHSAAGAVDARAAIFSSSTATEGVVAKRPSRYRSIMRTASAVCA